MTTINTMQDLIRLLDENPEWRDELRSRLLSKELLELPDKFARFVDEMRAFVARTEAFMETANRRFEQIDNSLNRIRNDIGQVKAGHARNMEIRYAPLIARELGLGRARTLVMDDLIELVDANDVTDISESDIDSFLRADLIMEAKDSQGERHYIAVEVSGACYDDQVKELIETESVHWHRLSDELIESALNTTESVDLHGVAQFNPISHRYRTRSEVIRNSSLRRCALPFPRS